MLSLTSMEPESSQSTAKQRTASNHLKCMLTCSLQADRGEPCSSSLWPGGAADSPGCALLCAAFTFSVYTPLLILFPGAAPLWKQLAHWFPDQGFQRVKDGRQVVVDIVTHLMAQRRKELALDQVKWSLNPIP